MTDNDTTEPMTPPSETPSPDSSDTMGMPPVAEEPASEPEQKKYPKWAAAAILATALFAMAGCGTAYGVTTHNEQPRYETAVSQAETAANKLATTVNTAEAYAKEIKPDQLQDAKTLDLLHTAIKKAKAYKTVQADAHQWLLWELKTGEQTLNESRAQATGLDVQVSKALKTVQASKAAKELADAQNALKAKTADGQKLYDATNGQVQDDNTRVQLKKLVDEANKLNSTTSKDYTDKTTAIQQAMDQVNASKQAKADADAKAAAEAAAAQQRAATAQRSTTGSNRTYRSNNNQTYGNSSTRSYRSSGSTRNYRPTYSSGNTGNTGKKPTAPAPTNNSGNQHHNVAGNGWSGGHLPSDPTASEPCTPDKYCPIG